MKKTFILGLTAATLALTSTAARAGDVRFSFNIGLPLPRLCVPAPAPPPPVCVTPPVVYVPSGYCYPGYVRHGYYVNYRPAHGHVKYYVAQPGYYCGRGY